MGIRQNIMNYSAKCLNESGYQNTPDHRILPANAFVADSRAEAVKQARPYSLSFSQTLFSHGNITEASPNQEQGYINLDAYDYVQTEIGSSWQVTVRATGTCL